MVVKPTTPISTAILDRDAHEVYIDGGRVIQSFLQADLIDEITVGVAPVLIGSGLPLFGAFDRDVLLELAADPRDGHRHGAHDVSRQRIVRTSATGNVSPSRSAPRSTA